eukprot:15467813-Alexandrium_andersonii.AAC.1
MNRSQSAGSPRFVARNVLAGRSSHILAVLHCGHRSLDCKWSWPFGLYTEGGTTSSHLRQRLAENPRM